MGFFCANDYMAAGAIDSARRHNINVPEELKVIGYDNRDFSEFWAHSHYNVFSAPGSYGRKERKVAFGYHYG